MADAFKTTSVSGLDKELENLMITDNQIQARVDSQNKTLCVMHVDQSNATTQISPQQHMMLEKIVLKSSDNEIFEVDEATARQLTTVALPVKHAVPVANVKGKILAKLIEYCKKHVDAGSSSDEDDLEKWDAEFMEVDLSTLFDLMMAAYHLNIKSLVTLSCQTIAGLLRNNSS